MKGKCKCTVVYCTPHAPDWTLSCMLCHACGKGRVGGAQVGHTGGRVMSMEWIFEVWTNSADM